MKLSTALAVLTLLVTHSLALAQPVRVESGLVEGVQLGASTVYKSIRFAAPPVGELRWRAPQPAPAWNGVKREDKFGPICTQQGPSVPGAPDEPVSEDCLTLSASGHRQRRDEQKLAVMVWIPGGGFTQESASMPLYWGDALAARSVVVVTINYRVELLGFLAHPELTRESGHNSFRQLWIARPDRGTRLDQTEHYRIRRRSRASDDLGSIRGIDGGQSAHGLAAGAGPLPARSVRAARTSSLPRQPVPRDGLFLKGAEEQGVKLAAELGANSLEALCKLESERFLKAAEK